MVLLQNGGAVELEGCVVEGYEQAKFFRLEPMLIVGICSKRICFWKKKDPLCEIYHWGGDLSVSIHGGVLRLGVCLPVKSEDFRDQMIASLEKFTAELRMGAETSMFTIASDYSGTPTAA